MKEKFNVEFRSISEKAKRDVKKFGTRLDESRRAIDDKGRERESVMVELEDASVKRQHLYNQAINSFHQLSCQVRNCDRHDHVAEK